MSSARPTTFNLSDVYRALGLRDPRVLPSIKAGELTPIISLGEFNTFAPEVIEARGFISQGFFNVLGGQWVGVFQQSTAPGGTVIEELNCGDGTTFNLAPQRPFTAAPALVLSTGGQPIISLFEVTGINIGPAPSGQALGGSASNPSIASGARAILGNVWVPPGWFWWVIMFGANPNAYAQWRFREMPEAQGPA